MSEIKLNADSGGGSVSFKGPATTTGNADVPFVLPVADGSAGQYLKTDGSKNLSFSGAGITELDSWRITSAFSNSAEPISSNWERDDTYGNGKPGTGMTESSGVFTFPSTGFWRVAFGCYWTNTNGDNDRALLAGIQYTSNAGTNWISAAYQQDSIWSGSADNGEAGAYVEKILDITDVSNQKVRFAVWCEASATQTLGNTNENRTYSTFIKLADT